MSVARLTVSLDEELARAVRQAAGKEPTSSWLADAARRKLHAQGLLRVVVDWEREHGPLRLMPSCELQHARSAGGEASELYRA